MSFDKDLANTHAGHEKYRPDIDGLRAISVGLVLGYHAFPLWVVGGFIGVDIFFVISGFLISSIIIGEIRDRKFHFANFYARRIKRIFPALICMLAAVYILGLSLLLTDEFQDLCKYIASSAGFITNFILLRDAGYFDTASEMKPLLHIWSLGIEEQFYFIWPVILILVSRIRISFIKVFATIFLASFLANLYCTGEDRTAAFYLPFTRFFELMIGSGVAYFMAVRRHEEPAGPLSARLLPLFDDARFCTLLSLAGAALVGGSALLLDHGRSFPGWWALMPTCGAALLIAAGSGAWVNRRVLANPVMVFFGLISYPLYLWHWPLLSFLRISSPNPSALMKLGTLTASVVLAWLTYRLVERPLRFGRFKGTVAALSAVMAALGLVAIGLNQWNGLNLRGQPDLLAQVHWDDADPDCLHLLKLEAEAERDAIFCSLHKVAGTVGVALLGDSMANALYPGLRDVYSERGVGLINLGVGTCAPFRGLYGTLQWNRDCDSVNERIYKFIADSPEIKTVVLGFSSWDIGGMAFDASRSQLTLAEKFEKMKKIVAADIRFLREHEKKIVVTFDGPIMAIQPRTCFLDASTCTIRSEVVEAPYREYLQYWSDVMREQGDVCVFRQAPVLSTNGEYSFFRDGKLLYRDDHHLSQFGSEVVAKDFAEGRCFDDSFTASRGS